MAPNAGMTLPFLATLFCVAGCDLLKDDVLVKVCGRSVNASGGPKCCAVGTLDVGTNKLQPASFSCEQTATACKDSTTSGYPGHAWSFTPDGGYKSNATFNSGCGPTKWEKKSPFSAFTTLAPMTSTVLSKVKTVPKSEPLDCRVDCFYDFPPDVATGDADRCPEMDLDTSVPARLFSFYAQVDPTAIASETEIVPIETIVAPAELDACKRTDIVLHRSGGAHNIGAACSTTLPFGIGDGVRHRVDLSVPSTLTGHVAESEGTIIRWMTFPTESESFSLLPESDALKGKYGGHVAKSGMIHDVAIAEIQTETAKACVRGRSDASISPRDADVLHGMTQSQLAPAMQSIITLVGGKTKAKSAADSDEIQPYFDSLGKIASLSSTQRIQVATNAFSKSGADKSLATVASVAGWLDAAACHAALFSDGKLNKPYWLALQKRFAHSEDPHINDSNNKKLIRCLSYPTVASAEFKAAVLEQLE